MPYVCAKLGMGYHALASRLIAIDEHKGALDVYWKVHPGENEMDAFKAFWDWEFEDAQNVRHRFGSETILRWDYESECYVDEG